MYGIQRIVYNTKNTMHRILCIEYNTQIKIHRINKMCRHNAQNTNKMDRIQCIEYNVQNTIQRIQCIKYNAQNAMHRMQCIEYNAQIKIHGINSASNFRRVWNPYFLKYLSYRVGSMQIIITLGQHLKIPPPPQSNPK